MTLETTIVCKEDTVTDQQTQIETQTIATIGLAMCDLCHLWPDDLTSYHTADSLGIWLCNDCIDALAELLTARTA